VFESFCLCVFVCVCLCSIMLMRLCACVYMRAGVCVCVCVYMCVCACVYIHVCTLTHTYIYMYDTHYTWVYQPSCSLPIGHVEELCMRSRGATIIKVFEIGRGARSATAEMERQTDRPHIFLHLGRQGFPCHAFGPFQSGRYTQIPARILLTYRSTCIYKRSGRAHKIIMNIISIVSGSADYTFQSVSWLDWQSVIRNDKSYGLDPRHLAANVTVIGDY